MILVYMASVRTIRGNNTPNASRQLCAPLGVTSFGLTELCQAHRIFINTPAMPLHDAHFGGFFVSGACR